MQTLKQSDKTSIDARAASQDVKATPIKHVKGPKASVATFIRPSDNKRIYVFTKKSETMDNAIKRVMMANGAKGGSYDLCN
jgi:hypothetical protein